MSRRQNRVSPLTIVLPTPQLSQRRSSLFSTTSSASSAPHTPRSAQCSSQPCASWVLNPSNRKSTDSWNSSNNDFGDDGEAAEWKPDHILLLSRTLDALPSHLVTPFHGPIPPSNLLDKIARGISQAKGPVEWPFSLRATRVKLIEIARDRAADNFHDENDGCVTSPGPAKKRPLYRQSSMDFIHESVAESQHDVESINRLSSRLQRNAGLVPKSSFHPYSRARASPRLAKRRSSSPPRPMNSLSTSNPSTSTLATLSSLSSRSHNRRSGGTVSSMTSNESLSSLGLADAKVPYQLLPSMTSAPDPRVQRVRRSESFCGPLSFRDSQPFLPPVNPIQTRLPLKRAPSYGAFAQESKEFNRAKAANDGFLCANSPCPSSDEEEKVRGKKAKKARTKTGSIASASSPPPSSPESRARSPKQCKESTGNDQSPSPGGKPSARQRMKPQRNASMFGAELLRGTHTAELTPALVNEHSPKVPQSPKQAPTLRRVKRLSLALAPSRRISFASLATPSDAGNDADAEDDGDHHLASAFQLR